MLNLFAIGHSLIPEDMRLESKTKCGASYSIDMLFFPLSFNLISELLGHQIWVFQMYIFKVFNYS